jgi:hypothetical protein
VVDVGKLEKHGGIYFIVNKTFAEGAAAKIAVNIMASPPPKNCPWTVNGYFLDGVNYKSSESHLVRCAKIYILKVASQ